MEFHFQIPRPNFYFVFQVILQLDCDFEIVRERKVVLEGTEIVLLRGCVGVKLIILIHESTQEKTVSFKKSSCE